MNRRAEAYRGRLVEAGAQWSARASAPVVAHFGAPAQEYWAVRDGGLGLADRSERETVVLSGADTIPWLQGLLTNDLMALQAEGSGQRSAAVNHIGRCVADVRLLHIPELLVLDLEPGTVEAGFVAHLKQHVIMEDVQIADRSTTTARLTLLGRQAPALLAERFWGRRRVEDLGRDYEGGWGELFGCDVLLQRLPLIGELAFDIFCDRDEALTIWDGLMRASSQVRPVGEQALEQMRLEAGQVRYGEDLEYHPKIIPIEADLNDIISYDKGCFLGQEVIHRLDTRGRPAKMLRVLVPENPDVELRGGDHIHGAEGKRAGEVFVGFRSPQLEEHSFGLAYVKRGSYDLGTQVTLARPEDDEDEGGPTELVRARVARLGEPLRMVHP